LLACAIAGTLIAVPLAATAAASATLPIFNLMLVSRLVVGGRTTPRSAAHLFGLSLATGGTLKCLFRATLDLGQLHEKEANRYPWVGETQTAVGGRPCAASTTSDGGAIMPISL
jgi:hypothetical protein